MNRRHRVRIAALPAAAVLVALSLTPTSQAAIGEAPPDLPPALSEALAAGNIPQALGAYDEYAQQHGGSAELLSRVARRNLDYCLDEAQGWARFEAARALFDLGDERGRKSLLAELDSPFATFRMEAATHLADNGVREAGPRLRKLATAADGVPYERVRAAKDLYRLGGTEVARNVLIEISRSEDPHARGQAVAMMLELRDPAFRPELEARLKDDVPLIALHAAEGLARLGVAAGREHLIALLDTENLQMAIAVAAALAELDEPAGGAEIRAILDRWLPEYPKVPDAVAMLVYLYGWIDPAGARPYLERGLTMEKWAHMRLLCARRLAEMGDPTALPTLVDLYGRYPEEDLATYREWAVRAAGWLGDRPEVRVLAQRAASDKSIAVRLAAIDVLARLGDAGALEPARRILGGPELLSRVEVAEAVIRFGSGPAEPPARPSESDAPPTPETPQ